MKNKSVEKHEILGLRNITLMTFLFLATLTSVAVQAGQPPHGYERLALHSPSTLKTGVFERKSTTFVYDHYANNLTIGGTTSEYSNVSDKRLIDIEVHVSGGANPKIEWSGIWIENDEYFKQDSWLTYGHPASDLINWPDKEYYIPLDIEKYNANNGGIEYAVIWQLNRHRVNWEVLLEVNSDDILRRVDDGYRVVEFDQVRSHYQTPPFSSDQYFDAVLVENFGDNNLNAVWKPIEANPLDTIYLDSSWTTLPEIFVLPELFPEFIDAPEGFVPPPPYFAVHFEGFNIFDDEKIVDVEFVEFPGSYRDGVFPETWALVISHPVPECKSLITEGVRIHDSPLFWTGYDVEHDFGRIIDYEGTSPFQNKPMNKPSVYGHNGVFYGAPGYAFFPTYILGCKRALTAPQ